MIRVLVEVVKSIRNVADLVPKEGKVIALFLHCSFTHVCISLPL